MLNRKQYLRDHFMTRCLKNTQTTDRRTPVVCVNGGSGPKITKWKNQIS